MKSFSNAIVGVTSGVAAFVVLDLVRHEGIDVPSIAAWRVAAEPPSTPSEDALEGVRAVAEAVGGSIVAALGAVVAEDGSDAAAAGESQRDPIPAAQILAGVAASEPVVGIDRAGGSGIAPNSAGTADAAPAQASGSSDTPAAPSAGDLARAGERAKALAAAMERLGKRLDGTANRGFPR